LELKKNNLLKFEKKNIKKNIEIEEDQIIYWTKQLLTAIDALHQKNIFHKFIIPE